MYRVKGLSVLGTVAHTYNPGLRRLNIKLKPGIPSEILSPKHNKTDCSTGIKKIY